MALEFNIAPADKFFLGEDKLVDMVILGADGVTPFDLSSLPLEWNMRKTDHATDTPLLVKGSGTGLSVVGVYNVNPSINTQRLRLTFIPADTAGLRAGVAYRHSCKRTDLGSAGILFYGSITFLQATEH